MDLDTQIASAERRLNDSLWSDYFSSLAVTLTIEFSLTSTDEAQSL